MRMVLFRASARREDNAWSSYDDRHNGWSLYVKGGIEVIEFPGDHKSVVRGEHARSSILLLKEKLRQAYIACGLLNADRQGHET